MVDWKQVVYWQQVVHWQQVLLVVPLKQVVHWQQRKALLHQAWFFLPASNVNWDCYSALEANLNFNHKVNEILCGCFS
jgi:hypothetical protein